MPRKATTASPTNDTDSAARPFAALDRWWWVWVIPGAMTLYRVLFLAFVSGLGLSEDEAQYWEWSRFLDWGYFTKPGGVAWSIAASTEIFGDSEFAVRLPAALAGLVGSLAVGLLARDMFKDHRIAALSCVAYLCVPAFAMLGFLMTIDGPVMAAWAVAAWGGHRALAMHDRRGWVWFGLAVAVGVQFKPTMLLILPGVLVFLVWDRLDGRTASEESTADNKPRSSAAPIALAVLLILVGFVPTILYNATHGWVQIGHLLGHLGFDPHEPAANAASIPNPWKPSWTLEYPVVQLAAGGAVSVLGIIGSLKILLAKPDESEAPNPHRRSVRWCVSLAAPLLVFYFAVSFFTRVEGNWPIAAWVTACPLAAWAALRGWALPDRGLRFGAWIGAGIGLLIPGILLVSPWIHRHESPLGLIPTHRLMGFEEVVLAVDAARDRERSETGLEPFIVTVSYGRAAQLAFYLPDHPTIYVAARYSPYGGSGRQYDIWDHTDLEHADVMDRLRGRPAVMLRRNPEFWRRAFTHVERIDGVEHEPGKIIDLYTGHDYRGFD